MSDAAPIPEQQPEPKPTGWKAQLAYRAKALVAGIGSLALGELTVLLVDQSFQSEVQHAAPPAYAPLIPIVFAILTGLITHGVSNGPKPAESGE